MSWCTDAPEDEAICLFAGLLANPDVPLSRYGPRRCVCVGWIHSNRRNGIGQNLVERLVHTHTNLKLEKRLEMYEDGLLPWDIEMTVEESVSDDDDGSPHRVSDPESESEQDSD